MVACLSVGHQSSVGQEKAKTTCETVKLETMLTTNDGQYIARIPLCNICLMRLYNDVLKMKIQHT